MIEPSGYGAGVLFGPNTRNFRDVVELLLNHEAAKVVADAEELTLAIRHWLLHPEEAAAFGQRAQKLVLSQQGATRKTVELLQMIAENQSSPKKSKAA
jgi:3-deoxy-D-manno-octulosonic-acid transferase